MSWYMTGAVDRFLEEAGDFLHADRARNTVLLTVTESLRINGPASLAGEDAGPALFGWWQAAYEGGGISGAFMHTPPWPALLTAVSDDAVTALATQLASAGRELSGVNAEKHAAERFAAVWRERTGVEAHVHRSMRLWRLDELVWPEPKPDGEPRIADDKDRELLISWFDAFAREVGDLASDHAAEVADRLSYGGLTLWQVDDVPVSVAGVTRTVAGMIRVSTVYTPPELRGRGYAGAATASVSRAALDAGTAEVLLYTDVANPTSNALYQRIGYRPVEDRIVLSFG